jgi:hypothetical protein
MRYLEYPKMVSIGEHRVTRLPNQHVLNRYHFDTLCLSFSDVTGPSRHWMSNVDYTSRKGRPGRNRKRRLDGGMCSALPRNLVRASAVRALGRFDLLASFAAQDAGKAPHRVGLLAGCLHDLGQRRALGAFHHGDHLSLLVGAVRFRFSGRLLGPASLFCGLGFLSGRTLALHLRSARFRRRDSLRIDCVRAHRMGQSVDTRPLFYGPDKTTGADMVICYNVALRNNKAAACT